jgi:hypothetical protein
MASFATAQNNVYMNNLMIDAARQPSNAVETLEVENQQVMIQDKLRPTLGLSTAGYQGVTPAGVFKGDGHALR